MRKINFSRLAGWWLRAALLAILFSSLGGLPALAAGGPSLADGQFVYGPNVGDFDVRAYLAANAPYLLVHADDLYQRAEYYSINPRVLLTLMELRGHMLSNPDPARLENPFGLEQAGFNAQVEALSAVLADAFYRRLYSANPGGDALAPAGSANAATFALAAGLASMPGMDPALVLDASRADGFTLTYRRLFGGDDPLDESNRLDGVAQQKLAAPAGLLQLPFARGLSWKFGGVHDNSGGGGVGTPFNDGSSMDFYPAGSTWGMDTSGMWVVAAAAGTPTKVSPCYVTIAHSDGWVTTYYHLENVQSFGSHVNQNDKIAVIANTEAEATCSGGAATGPHVHFSLRYNGALVAINGTSLSYWMVHAGRWNYDTDPNYMWLERGGAKKFPFNNTVLSEGTAVPPVVVSVVRDSSSPLPDTARFTVTFSAAVTGVDAADFALNTTGLTGAALSGVSGTGAVYTVSAATGSGDGSLRLDLVDNDSIKDAASTPLGGSGAGNGSFTAGETFLINRTPGYFVIAGGAGVPGAQFNYTDGSPKAVTANASGLYSLAVPSGWAGSVTPVRAGYSFAPASRDYSSTPVTGNLPGQDFAPTVTGVATFADVPVNYWAWEAVEMLVKNGVTSGCSASPKLYCPAATVTRDQMAIFLLRAKYGAAYVPPAATGVFADVPVSFWAAAWIEQLAADGITSGCSLSPRLYCPLTTVTREQMAVFLLRAKNGSSYSPPAASGVFADVPAGLWSAAWIEDLAAQGITGGCSLSPKLYCPGNAVARDQMAVFLMRTFGLK